jgi:cbb3-type cytochrome oxidase subunit 1
MAQWVLLETLMWVNIQRITGVAHCANVVWPDLDLRRSHYSARRPERMAKNTVVYALRTLVQTYGALATFIGAVRLY